MIYLASLVERTEDKIDGYHIVKTKLELDCVVSNNTQVNGVKMRADFVKKYFTPSGILAYIENAKRLNRNLIIELDSESNVLTSAKFIRKIKGVRNLEELIILATAYPKETLDSLSLLTAQYEEHKEELLAASSMVSRLQDTIDEKEREKNDLSYALKVEQENKFRYASHLSSLIRRVNYQYNKKLSEKKLFHVDSNNYDRVVYIKEITRVQFVDSMIYYLKEILKVLYSMPTRFVTIESFYGTGKARLYRDLVPHYALKERDVLAGDILMLGFQPKLMEDILKNSSNISVLIILDRGGYSLPHLKGENVEYVYTVSDLADAPKDVPRDRIISYSEETMFIPLIRRFGDLDKGEKMTRYSSMGIIKQIIAMIESR